LRTACELQICSISTVLLTVSCVVAAAVCQVRGKNPPRPIRAWTQSGISSKVLEMLRKQGFDRPLAIQAQVGSGT
jgi:hypothetical protein